MVFCAMLLNDAVKLDVLRGWIIDIMESAFKELRWSTLMEWVRHNRELIAGPLSRDRQRPGGGFRVW